jgi:hypothetical protein
MVRLALSNFEACLLEDIREIGYGEIFTIEYNTSPPAKVHDIHEEEENLIRILRAQKQFSKIIIHDGLPKLAEINGTTQSGRKFTKKFKF